MTSAPHFEEAEVGLLQRLPVCDVGVAEIGALGMDDPVQGWTLEAPQQRSPH